MKVKNLIAKIQAHRKLLKNDFQVEGLYIFGSFAKGKTSFRSDVDILVDFSKPVTLFDFVRLREFLETITKRKVDLVTRDALKIWMKSEVERDLIRAA